jgi:hypothetical protein
MISISFNKAKKVPKFVAGKALKDATQIIRLLG